MFNLFQRKPFYLKKNWFKKAKKKFISERIFSFRVSDGCYGSETFIFVSRRDKRLRGFLADGDELSQFYDKILTYNFIKGFLMAKRFCSGSEEYNFSYRKKILDINKNKF